MGRRKRKEPEYIEAEPISLVLPEAISVAEFLGRRMLYNREGQQQKVDTVEKEVDSPTEAVLSKKVGKKDKTSKKRVSFADAKSKEVEHKANQLQITKTEKKDIIPLHHVLLFDFEIVVCVIFMCLPIGL